MTSDVLKFEIKLKFSTLIETLFNFIDLIEKKLKVSGQIEIWLKIW